MRSKKILFYLCILACLAGLWPPALPAQAVSSPNPKALVPQSEVTAFDLMVAMNSLRMSYGLPALIEDPIVNAVAQATAETMAINQMSWHIGNVRGRLAAAGYGGGVQVWATENFAVGNMEIDEIMAVWADAEHMRPAVTPAYCHVGAGVAKAANGMTYYVLQAAYTSSKACGEYTYNPGVTPQPGSGGVSQWIVPVKTATPDAEGKIYHEVQAGQSLWAIAIAYQITIRDLEVWNNLSRNTALRVGQRLFIPGSNTEGYATPTPVGMVVPSTPGADGKIVHVVQPYQTLFTISQAYQVTVETLLALNGWREEWPLQIGQALVIFPGNITPSPTPRPLTPLEKLTPASDGKYYHAVQSGETLSWIAGLYEIPLADLMAWNGLNSASIIRPSQQLLLLVTPPIPPTDTPLPPTITASPTPTLPLPTRSRTFTPTPPPPTVPPLPDAQPGFPATGWWVGIVVAAAGLAALGAVWARRRA